MFRAVAVVCGLAFVWSTAAAPAKTSHDRWPVIEKGHLFKQSIDADYEKTGTDGSDEILGHHGSDTLAGGAGSDVLWGDWDPSDQPTSQTDRISGGSGDDFIYSSHGHNFIDAGAGADYVKVHFGYGTINCGPGRDILEISPKAQKRSKIKNCELVTHRTLGY